MAKDIKLTFKEFKELLQLTKNQKKKRKNAKDKLNTRTGMIKFNQIRNSGMRTNVTSRPLNMNQGSSIDTRQIENFRADVNRLKNQLVRAEVAGNKDDENLFRQALVKLEPALLMAERFNNPKTDGKGDFTRKSFLESTVTKENFNKYRQENSLSNRLRKQNNYTPIHSFADLRDVGEKDTDDADNDISMITEQEEEFEPEEEAEFEQEEEAEFKPEEEAEFIPEEEMPTTTKRI